MLLELIISVVIPYKLSTVQQPVTCSLTTVVQNAQKR